MPPRIFIEADTSDGTRVAVSGADARHLAKVLRARKGDPVVAVGPHGREWDAVIDEISPSTVGLLIARERAAIPEPPVSILLGQGIGKGQKLDLVVRAATELGVAEIVPVASARAIADASETKSARLSRIAQEACKQCGRSRVPRVHAAESLDAFLARASDCESKLVAFEGGGATLAASAGRAKKVAMLIGPEGGFAPEEIARAEKAGFVRVSLGPRILRTETAGIAAVALLQHILGDIV